MWLADNWKDYEVLDASGGEKLERWGKYLLIRPDPQVIWDTPKTHRGWVKPNAHYHRSDRGGGSWEFFDLPEQWEVSYVLAGAPPTLPLPHHPHPAPEPHPPRAFVRLTFRLKPFSFKHTGLFPEQAANWEWIYEKIAAAKSAHPDVPVRILNLFAYTGGATLAAAAAGATVTHVDASKGMVGWAKENAKASGLADAPIRYLVDDCVKFVEREARRGNTYDGIIMDPPSYGRGPKGEVWKMEASIHGFIRACVNLLSPRPLFFLISSYTTGLAPGVLGYLLGAQLSPHFGNDGQNRGSLPGAGPSPPFGGTVRSGELGLPVTASGLVLPCGASGRWEI
ncbi:MAG: class I SAM-dependent methyltransferase [Lachnospiraceae bacterium]|jgi:23S rRNA (cytosine1962-C5)-methyltransferase|nr:class I SAM-dependent methyltransferase [Lachnospiraceae bacterium]